MSVVEDLHDALDAFSSDITVHPALNMLDGGKLNELHETVPFVANDLITDTTSEKLCDPVVPKAATFTENMAQSLSSGGNSVPRTLAWYSEHAYRLGTLVEYNGHVYQINQIADYDKVAGIFVYDLKGDDSFAPMGPTTN